MIGDVRKRFEVNGLNYRDASLDPPLYQIRYKRIYEFEIFSQVHQYHQHVYPFQVQKDYG